MFLKTFEGSEVGDDPVAEGLESPGPGAGFLKGFLFAAVFVLIIFCFVPVRYETNDDFALVKKLSERSGFSPDPHDATLGFSLGWILYFLYGCAPEVPWYGLFVCAVSFLGMSLMLSVLFRSTQGLSLLLSLPLLGMVFFHIFSFVSFTSASLILELGVFLCLMEWVVRDRCPARNPRFYAWALAFAFLACYLLRWRLVLASVVFGGPILFFVQKRQMAKAISALMVVGLVILGDRALFYLLIPDEHKAFIEYNYLRAKFHDTARGDDHGDVTRNALKKVGWSPKDYAFYKQWILYDNTKFNAETLRTFLAENDPKQEDSLLVLKGKRLERHFQQGKHYVLALLFSVVSIWVYRAGSVSELAGKNRLKIVLALAYIGGGILLVVSMRSVLRVFVPLYAYFFGACFFFLHLTKRASPNGRSRSLRRNVAVTCAAIVSILAWGQAYAQGKTEIQKLERSKAKKDYVLSRLNEVKEKRAGSDPLLILMNPAMGGGLGEENIHPLREFSDFAELRVFPGGWGINSPRYFSILREMGLEDGRAFLEWIVDNEDALLVLMAEGGIDVWRWRAQWESYFSRQIVRNRKVSLVPVYDFRDEKSAGLVLFGLRSSR